MTVKQNQEALPLIQQGDQVLIDARVLHENLNVGTVFAKWIKSRISDYSFEDGSDFFSSKEKSMLGRPRVDYHLTLDMAKELAMLERNEVGRQIRRYFIAMERRVREQHTPLPAPDKVFEGLKPRKINDRLMYPYTEVKARCGYSRKSSSSNHKVRYWMHFVKEGDLLYITEDFARHLYYQKQVMINRTVLRASHPVLPMNFGDTMLLNHG